MIPDGVQPIGLEEVAAVFGVPKDSLVSRGPHKDPDFATDLNPGGRTRLWDPVQVAEYRAGTRGFAPYPELPTDWLNDHEAAAAAGVAVFTWRGYLRDTKITPVTRVFRDVRFHQRSSITSVYKQPPGRGGRPAGSNDKTKRESRKEADAERIAKKGKPADGN